MQIQWEDAVPGSEWHWIKYGNVEGELRFMLGCLKGENPPVIRLYDIVADTNKEVFTIQDGMRQAQSIIH